MKPFITSLLAGGLALNLFSQTPTNTKPRATERASQFSVVERGPDHRVWERLVDETAPNGKKTQRKHSYTEVATGMHYQENGKWEESREEIELFKDGAVARHGQHKAIFAANLATEGAIDIETPTGVRLRSHVLGLSYFDSASGKSVLIAEVKDCVGEVEPPNVVIYRDAFTDLAADVRYTYTRSGFEQDVILREKPLPPEDYGLNPKTTRLQVLTEFVNPPTPTKTVGKVREEADETLDFGHWRMVPGKAFSEPGTESVAMGGVGIREGEPVTKQWRKLDGRDFLIEEVKLNSVERELEVLPPKQASLQSVTNSILQVASTRLQLPPKRKAASASTTKSKMQLALAKVTATPGFVMDYGTVFGYTNNYTFEGDKTYYISGPANFLNTTIIEGGAVLKFTNTVWSGTYLSQPYLALYGPLECRTAPYRPAILTAKDDNTVGETIAGSTGNPTGAYAYIGLSLHSNYANDLHDLRLAYMGYGITLYDSTNFPHTVRNCQFLNSERGVYAQNVRMAIQNSLFYRMSVSSVFGRYSTLFGEHLTIHQANRSIDEGTFSLTNSLLVLVTNWPTGFTSCNNATSSSPTVVFETVGAGAHYLVAGSTNRDGGTTNISPSLLAALNNLTTYPPIIQSNATVATDTTLSPFLTRDTNAPDLGYHYAPIDYLAYAYSFTNCTLTINPGTVIAYYDATGLWMKDGATIVSEGTPLSPVRFADHHTVQELPIKYVAGGGFPVNPYRYNSVGSPARFRFTEFSRLATGGAAYNFYISDSSWRFSELTLRDCAIYNGTANLWPMANVILNFQNNLHHRTWIGLTDFETINSVSFRNNLFYGGTFFYDCENAPLPTIKDNAFHGAQVGGGSDPELDHGYNAYINSNGRIFPTNAYDVVLSSFSYTNGPLGNYYQASNSLQDKGSRKAYFANLYHHTTSADQAKEADTAVDIGYHYVGLDANGSPFDSDGDGVPDYILWDDEHDALPDDWEITYFGNSNPRPNADYDGDGLSNSQEFEGGSAPSNLDSDFDGLIDSQEVGVAQLRADPPSIAYHPFSQTLFVGQDAFLTVAPTGLETSNYRFQWWFGSQVIPGATNQTLVLPNAQVTNAGNYWVIVSNTVGAVRSKLARVTIWSTSLVSAWGNNGSGQTNVPSGLTNAVAVAGGLGHFLAIRNDGSVIGWGDNSNAEIATPSNLTNAVAVAAGETHSMALRSDGTVTVWGSNSAGQTNVPVGLSNVVAVAAGRKFSMALRDNGTVVVWGDNSGGGTGQTNVPIGLSNVVGIAGGEYHVMALKSDGTITGWGASPNGELAIPGGLNNIMAVSAGYSCTGVLRQNGTVLVWGSNSYGQTNTPTVATNVCSLVAGPFHLLALRRDGALVGWGKNDLGQSTIPTGLAKVATMAAGGSHTVALLPPDFDGDGLEDYWEFQRFGNLTQSALGDYDSDGFTNLEEFQRGTDPTNLSSSNLAWFVSVSQGSDSYNGRAAAWDGVNGPFATINKALSQSLGSDSVDVAAGDYHENVDLSAQSILFRISNSVILQ